MRKEVEFNNGFVTALALFYGHYFQWQESNKIFEDMRIYPATDHLLDIEYPKNLDPEVKKKVQEFVRDVLSVRLSNISREEGEKFFRRCIELLKLIDEKCFGLKVKVKYL
jgi:hypothetical protein